MKVQAGRNLGRLSSRDLRLFTVSGSDDSVAVQVSGAPTAEALCV